jgi:alpha-tubulin suppressor-like RCC1 family protein
MSQSRSSVVQFLETAVLVLALGACAQEPTASERELAQLRVQAGTAGSAIASVVGTVTAPDMATPLRFSFLVQDGVAAGTITIRAGSPRLIVLRAYNGAGIETHRGSVNIDVVAGNNPTVSFVLEPLLGDQPIVVQVGSVTILISPQAGTLSVGETIRLRAAIIDAGGDTVPSSAGWATPTPGVVRVDAAGLVTAAEIGSGQIVATYAGFGAAAQIEVRGSIDVIPQALSAGFGHTCALTSSGAAYCWGFNFRGALGDGSTVSSSVPVAVFDGFTFSALAAGGYHTCGLTGSGAAYCWGATGSSIPFPVSGGLRFTTIAPGMGGHICALAGSGAAHCWGANDAGELGDGSTTSRSTPIAVSGGLTFSSLAVGYNYTCALTGSGAAYCWGDNFFGQLGTGSKASSSVPVAVAGGLSFSTLAAAFEDRGCGLTSSGAAYCWGDNFYGQLGTGSTVGSYAPVAVAGGLSFSALALGWGHTCGLTSSGAAYCWGWNNSGQLGNGSSANSSVPVAVAGGLSFSALAAGSSYTCGLTSTGSAYCWGYNYHGELGDGSTTNRSIPVAVSGGLIFGAAPGPTSDVSRGTAIRP